MGAHRRLPDAVAPDTYKGLEKPLAGNVDAADSGKLIYEERCQSCHGELALGVGPRAGELNPAA